MMENIYTQEELADIEVQVHATIRNLRQLQATLERDFEDTIGELKVALDEAYSVSAENGQIDPSPLQEAVADYQRMEMAAIRGGRA